MANPVKLDDVLISKEVWDAWNTLAVQVIASLPAGVSPQYVEISGELTAQTSVLALRSSAVGGIDAVSKDSKTHGKTTRHGGKYANARFILFF